MQKKWFGERNGYVKVEDVIVRETVTESFLNGTINMYVDLENYINYIYNITGKHLYVFRSMDEYIYKEFLNRNMRSYTWGRMSAIYDFLERGHPKWYELFSLLECSCYFLREHYDLLFVNYMIDGINRLFERDNYSYRMNKETGDIIEVTSDSEIESINEALSHPVDNVRTHLETAIKLLSAAQKVPDYRNSVKESISAVEACCRNITGETTLDKAIAKLEGKGVVINSEMKKGFSRLYYYTNDEATGIRHALMDDVNAPTSDEAIYMLVVCSAFINYLTKKNIQ